MKIYNVERKRDQVVATVNREPLRHIVTFCPTAFYFGYGGNSPSDLALSILADYLGENPTKEQLFYGNCRCWMLHQDFKQQFLDAQHGDSFTITEEEITLWLAQRAKNARRFD